MRRKWRAIIIGFSLFALAGGTAYYFQTDNIWVRSFRWSKRSFDSAEWKRCAPEGTPELSIEEVDTRGTMLFDLLRKHRLIGMSRSEMEALLGGPDWFDGDNVVGYGIGNHSGLGIDPDVLFVSFDESNRIRKIWWQQL